MPYRISHNVAFIGDQHRLACNDRVIDVSSKSPSTEKPFDVSPVTALVTYPDSIRFAASEKAASFSFATPWPTASSRTGRPTTSRSLVWRSIPKASTSLRARSTGKSESGMQIPGRLGISLHADVGAVHQVAWSLDGHGLAAAGNAARYCGTLPTNRRLGVARCRYRKPAGGGVNPRDKQGANAPRSLARSHASGRRGGVRTRKARDIVC